MRQKLMHHETAGLTNRVYTHDEVNELAQAVKRLELLPERRRRELLPEKWTGEGESAALPCGPGEPGEDGPDPPRASEPV